MFLKLIICQTTDPSRFAAGQQAWRPLAEVPGFLGQLGGWSVANAREAVILGLWQDAAAYERFMVDRHDGIAADAGQAAFIGSIQVQCFEQDLDIPGRYADLAALIRALAETRPAAVPCLRLVDCTVHAEARDGFRQGQQALWNPALTANGVLAGLFGVGVTDPQHFLTVSVWESAAVHDAYNRHVVPQLMRQVDVISTCRTIGGRVVALDPDWSVGGQQG
jgi:heme-degrading monooxygenase HmoA